MQKWRKVIRYLLALGFSGLMLSVLIVVSVPLSSSADEAEPERVRLQQFKPIYFLAGHPDTKIQLSFKVKFIKSLKLYFVYTQIMF